MLNFSHERTDGCSSTVDRCVLCYLGFLVLRQRLRSVWTSLSCCCLSKADLTSSFALQMDEDGASLESGPQGSGIPAGVFSMDVIDFLAK